jgi:hypothetical protein
MIRWHSEENPYKNNIFTLAKIPTSETDRERLRVRIANARLTGAQRDRIIISDQRFEEELLAHRAHAVNRSLLERHLKEFGQLPISLEELSTVELTIEDISNLLVFPEKGIDPVPGEVEFNYSPSQEREEVGDETLLDF